MKKVMFTAVALLAAGIVSLSSCDKIKDLAKVNFTLENAEGAFSIPELTAVGNVALGTDDLYINLDSIIKAQNKEISAKNIKEVRIKSCELNLTNGDEKNNFAALEACQLEIRSNVKTDFIKMASVSNNPDITAYKLNLPVESGLDLKDYFLSATRFSYRLSGKTRKTTDKELNCTVLVKYTLSAGL